MMEMRVMMVMNLNGGKLHRFLYSSHIAKAFASETLGIFFHPQMNTDKHR
jgi:hypothetical protein